MYNLGSFLLVAILSMLAINSFGQNWLSSSSGTGNIYYNQGNVGIGVTDPQWKLDVNGDINIPFTRKMGYRLHDEFNYDGRVQPHYGLQWVPDTESPGSGTLWQSGYGGIKFFTAGQVRFKLLEKVEELTLYLIVLKKENELINKRIELLESK